MTFSNLSFLVLHSGCCVKADGGLSNTKMVVISVGVVEWESGHISEVLERTNRFGGRLNGTIDWYQEGLESEENSIFRCLVMTDRDFWSFVPLILFLQASPRVCSAYYWLKRGIHEQRVCYPLNGCQKLGWGKGWTDFDECLGLQPTPFGQDGLWIDRKQ